MKTNAQHAKKRGRANGSPGSLERDGSAAGWTWKQVAEELYNQGRRMRARLENLGHYSEGWDVVANFAAKKLGKTKPPNDPSSPTRPRNGPIETAMRCRRSLHAKMLNDQAHPTAAGRTGGAQKGL